jgi:hypothetical protein
MIKSRRMMWAGRVARIGGEEECIWDIGGKARRKEPLGRPSHRWVDHIKMGLKEIGWGGMH